MAVSRKRWKFGRAGAVEGASSRAMFHKILYRSLVAAALAAEVVSMGAVSRAQEERPQIFTGERKVARKKDAGPRAVAVLQVGAKGKMALVPIAIMINGKFWDASAYKANPVPMALEPGTVYEAERTGSSQGLFVIGSALHSTSVRAQIPWIGTGAWSPVGDEKPGKEVKAENVPKGIDTTDDRPRLTRNPQAAGAGPASTGQSGQSPAAGSEAPAASSSGSSSGDEPPRLKRPADETNSGAAGQAQAGSGAAAGDAKPAQGQAGSNQAGPNQPSSSQSGSSQAGPGKGGEPGGEKSAEAQVPESDSGATEEHRPRLRRAKPAHPFTDDDFPGYSKPGAGKAGDSKAAATANADKAAEAKDKEVVQLIPAISDAGGPIPHAFTFDWLKDEEGERRQQITELAKEKLLAYLNQQTKQKIAPKPTAAAGARRAAAVKAPEPVLSNVQMTTYDLWTSNQPIMVFSAEVHVPPPATPGPGYSDVAYFITLVARTDIYNNLFPLYSGVTDKFHLDLTPRLELVDAVDADGDGRGELLFKKTSDAGTGWVIYRASADKLWKMFDSLNPE